MPSRYSFRDPAGEVAYQKQLRDRYLELGTPEGVDLSLKRARVVPVSREIARSIILKYEWLGTMSGTSLHFAIMFGSYVGGVTCVAVNGTGAAGSHRHHEFGISRTDLATLARGACVHWAPKGANSKLVSWTTKLLAKAKAAKLVIAYSDPEAGEIGTVYQACNWVYVGKTTKGAPHEIVAPNNRVYNIRRIQNDAKANRISWGRQRRLMEAAGWRIQTQTAKGKYVAVLDPSDDALAARVRAMTQPYPKRVKPKGEASPVQGGEGGSTPTHALQSTEAIHA